MTTQITHQRDSETGHYRQIVDAATLRRILRRDGESLERPRHFSDQDEWNVGRRTTTAQQD